MSIHFTLEFHAKISFGFPPVVLIPLDSALFAVPHWPVALSAAPMAAGVEGHGSRYNTRVLCQMCCATPPELPIGTSCSCRR